MGKREYSNYQKDVIGRYYANVDSIALDNLQKLVTELYLADSEKKRQRLWERAHTSMKKLKVKSAIVEHIMKQKDVTVLAKNVEDWLKSKK
jgi:hypothetical protein